MTEFLLRHRYPFDPPQGEVLGFEVGPGPGLLYFTPVSPGIVALHACAAPSARGRWLTRRVIRAVSQALRDSGVTHVVSAPLSAGLVDILRRLHFTVTPSGELAVGDLQDIP